MNISIGSNDEGKEIVHNLTKLPVILMAGQSDSGKSILAHSIICSLIKQYKSSDLKLMLIDCKQVEFIFYKNIPYLFVPVSNCCNSDIVVLDQINKEILRRKQVNIKKPFIFVVIDEFSDLAYQFPAQLESLVDKIAAAGSKTGVGLLLFTSRLDKEVITPKLDKLIETRIGFETASDIDSETIIHQKGCTELLGKGDGLYLRYSDSKPIHFQAPHVTEEEIEETVSIIKSY